VDGSAHLVLAPSCQAYLLDRGGALLWGPSNAPADPLLHPPPCMLALARSGALQMLDGNGNVLWDSAVADEAAGPYTLTNANGLLTETDAVGNVVWQAPGAPAWTKQVSDDKFELPGGWCWAAPSWGRAGGWRSARQPARQLLVLQAP
jgi:hypothetical protein